MGRGRWGSSTEDLYFKNFDVAACSLGWRGGCWNWEDGLTRCCSLSVCDRKDRGVVGVGGKEERVMGQRERHIDNYESQLQPLDLFSCSCIYSFILSSSSY